MNAQPPVTPHLSEQLPRRAQSTPNLSEDIASGSQPAAAAAAQLPRADSSLAGLGARMRSSSQHEKKSATAGISARSRSSAGSLPGLATPAAAAAAAAAAASLSSSPSGSGGVQQNGSLGRAGSGMLKPIQSGVQHPSVRNSLPLSTQIEGLARDSACGAPALHVKPHLSASRLLHAGCCFQVLEHCLAAVCKAADAFLCLLRFAVALLPTAC